MKFGIEEIQAIIKPHNDKLMAEGALQLVEDALGALAVRKNFRHNDHTNDFVGSDDDENAIDAAADDLAKAIQLLKPIAGY